MSESSLSSSSSFKRKMDPLTNYEGSLPKRQTKIQCFYGSECKRLNCSFLHDRKTQDEVEYTSQNTTQSVSQDAISSTPTSPTSPKSLVPTAPPTDLANDNSKPLLRFSRQQPLTNQHQTPKPCRFGANCREISRCRFYHGNPVQMEDNPTRLDYLPTGSNKIESKPLSQAQGSSRPCRYGLSCRRNDCRFYHGEEYFRRDENTKSVVGEEDVHTLSMTLPSTPPHLQSLS
eukprot:TRINITY_DN15083_c0_g1_i1.p1 TRINITY_DN15083_c0_g1~~TRINITY_DN15083_c0_g1_i1.p1  ORF type:complete len:266 (-),score=20.61 TRINITY_DN15083_c0_g1_i1:12-704(-)